MLVYMILGGVDMKYELLHISSVRTLLFDKQCASPA
jgi:hypothetical protein